MSKVGPFGDPQAWEDRCEADACAGPPIEPAPTPDEERERWYLAIRQCPRHHYSAIVFETEKRGGHRLTPSKCCGGWDRLAARWEVDPTHVAAAIIAETWESSTQEQRFALKDRVRAIIKEESHA